LTIVKGLLKSKLEIDKHLDKILCKQCGECCHEVDLNTNPPTILESYCEMLQFKGGKASCKLYPNHHGYLMKCGATCVPINMVFNRANDCLYNQIYPVKET